MYRIERKRINEKRDDIIDTFQQHRSDGFNVKDAAMAAANIHDRSYTFVIQLLKAKGHIAKEKEI